MLLYPVDMTHTIHNRRNRPHATRVFAKNRKRPPFSTLPRGINLKNAIFRTFLTKKVTFFTIFSIFLHTCLSDTHKFGTVGFVSLRRIHFHPPFHSVSPFQYQKID